MSQWKGFQLLIIVDLPSVNCPLVSFLATHHNNCVIDELCWFLQPQLKLPLKTKWYIFNLCKVY
jgi:hypothetical protein